MRIIDADILSYALYDEHVVHKYAFKVIEKAIKGEYKIYKTHNYFGNIQLSLLDIQS